MATDKPVARQAASLPDKLAVFPLSNALLLPHGNLPLRVFETRYCNMVEDVLKTKHRLIGIIQPSEPNDDNPRLRKVGCAGKLVSYTDQEDGTYLILLSGRCRFAIAKELPPTRGYRNVKPVWHDYLADLQPCDREAKIVDHAKLRTHLKEFLQTKGLAVNWELISGAPDLELVTTLAMLCPFSSEQQQKLLETTSDSLLASKLLDMLEDSSLRNINSSYSIH